MRILSSFFIFIIPMVSWGQYRSHPFYEDSVAIFAYTSGYMRNDRDSVFKKTEVEAVNKMVEDEIEKKCSGKVVPVVLSPDSVTVKQYTSEVQRMMKAFAGINGYMEDKMYLQLFRFTDSLCTKLRKEAPRFLIGTYYRYNYNASAVQQFQNTNPQGIPNSRTNTTNPYANSYAAQVNNSERTTCFFVIDLNTRYPVYYQIKSGKYRRGHAPGEMEVSMDLLSANHYFKGIRKKE